MKRPYSFPLIINIQLFCCAGGDLPRPKAMVLSLYSNLIVQFQELVEIILTLNIHWRIKGGGARGPSPLLIKLVKV